MTPTAPTESGALARGFRLSHTLGSFGSQGLASVLDKRGFCRGRGGELKFVS